MKKMKKQFVYVVHCDDPTALRVFDNRPSAKREQVRFRKKRIEEWGQVLFADEVFITRTAIRN